MSDPRVVRWLDGDEAVSSRTRRKTVLLQTLERYVTNPHTRGGIVGEVHVLCTLVAKDAYEAGLRDGEKPVRDALEARGLPADADLATLVSHERANAKLAGTFDALGEITREQLHPLMPPRVKSAPSVMWVHGTRLGREHTSVRQHLVEDHGDDPDVVNLWSDAQAHGAHDGSHNRTWAYAVDLPHEKSRQEKIPHPTGDDGGVGMLWVDEDKEK